MSTLVGGSRNIAWQRQCPRSSVGSRRLTNRDWLQTKNTVDPGRYSHRSTAFERNERTRLSGFENWKLSVGATAGAGCTVYTAVPGSYEMVEPLSRPYRVKLKVRGVSSSLKFA